MKTVTQTLSSLIWISLPMMAANASDLSSKVPLATKGSASTQPWQRYSDWPDNNYNKFNTLKTQVSPAGAGLQKLSGPIKGDPTKGAELAFDRARGGSCVACHIMGPDTPELPGNTGPDLSTIGSVGHPDEYLYNYVYDPRVYNPATIMPPWGAHGVFTKTEIEDIVAYLKTLKQQSTFKSVLDNPATRPKPVEDRDNLDPVENPAMESVDTGEEAFKAVGPLGKSCASCHSKPETLFKNWAGSMPKYSPKMKKVLGVEEFIARHGKATTGNPLLMQSEENIGLAIYLRYLANGSPINSIPSSAAAKQALKNGERLMHKKIGQLNFACMDCHSSDKGANKWIRGQWLGEVRGQADHFPTWRTSRAEIWDIRKRFQWCNVAVRGNELPPDASEYGDIELYLNSLNQGLKLSVPGIRH